MKRRPKYDIVLRALERGDTINLDGRVYAFSDEGKICTRLQVFEGDKMKEERWCECDMGLNEFFGYCKELTEEDILSIVARTVLQEDR